MKKLSVCVAIFFIFLSKISCLGTGFLLSYTPGTDFDEETSGIAGAAFSLKTDNIPLQISIYNQYNFFQNDITFTFTEDFLPLKLSLSSFAEFYSGIGSMEGVSFNKESLSINVAPRVILGWSITKFDGFFEFFTQAAVEPVFKFGFNRDYQFMLNIPVNAGMIFWY